MDSPMSSYSDTYRQVICTSLLTLLLSFSPSTMADNKLAYFGLEPDIVTNYVSVDDKRLGYVRVTVELMIEDYEYLSTTEHHAPLLRATIIEIFGKQSESQVKSLVGREDIRRAILQRLKLIMRQETGNEIIKNVIFTKYLYEG